MTVLRPDRFVAGGEVLARDAGGRVVFVRGALPGESVRVELVTEKRDWARASTVEVITPSAERVDPPCPHRRAGCGGCDWMHVRFAAQIDAKASIVDEALRRTGRIDAPCVHIGGAVAPTAYRTTVRVVATDGGALGFRSAESHDVVPTPGCLVVHPALAEVMATATAAPGLEATLRVSTATGQLTARWDRRRGTLEGLPPETRCGPDAAIDERVHGTMLRVSAGSFFQSGPAAAELLIDTIATVVPELADATDVVDAYAGVGLFAACAAPPNARVTAIESSRRAALDARHNLLARRATVITADVADATIDGGADVVIADPARSGLGKPGASAIARIGAPLIGLVSCDPAALARDAGLLNRFGYTLEHVTVLDLFPHTHHVETVSRFVRRSV